MPSSVYRRRLLVFLDFDFALGNNPLFTALALSLKPIFCPVRILRRMVDSLATIIFSSEY
tara:strand:- start:483 stop:662 length:180 start_codon:yes stop_codon:yes gene_type:complete